ncbi:hypothetical protein DFP72DRAFT_178834 [Ephemerocybe angulata]|uniref:Nephrocystin 3-like N-terminal domain-containing protein n=1 Tax=Ephemerocybe angulata TaxID=980116 RepID=A0A8H6MC39_9AGAR|nr:hypothetical protein DFP72DRAFT_178834 [Tulosesus angulatus]
MSSNPIFFNSFEGASHIAFPPNTTFVNSAQVTYRQVEGSSPQKVLHQHIPAGGASYDTNELASSVSICLPGTRVEVIDAITQKLLGATHPKRILWMTGPAGSGKSAIARSIADELKKKGLLAASFFFMRGASEEGLRTKTSFVATLAYQLQLQPAFPDAFSHAIYKAILSDADLFEMPLDRQLEALVLEPLRQISIGTSQAAKSQWPKVIVVDGVDECGLSSDVGSSRYASRGGPVPTAEDAQREILNLLKKAAEDPAFPFSILISSRPNFKSFFSRSAINVADTLSLDHFNADADIAEYLKTELTEYFRVEFPDFPDQWLSEDTYRALAKMACGQFNFALAVLAFIMQGRLPPAEAAKVVLGLRSSKGFHPFAQLDALHMDIIQTSPQPEIAIQWLCAIDSEVLGAYPAAFVRRFLSSAGVAEDAHLLNKLSSLIAIPPTGDESAKYTIFHQVLKDFLNDEDRCNKAGQPYINEINRRKFILGRYISILKCKGPEISVSPEEREAFLDVLVRFMHELEGWIGQDSPNGLYFQASEYLACDVEWWIQTLFKKLGDHAIATIQRTYNNVHGRECQSFSDTPACNHWRKAIIKVCAAHGWNVPSGNTSTFAKASQSI